MSEASEKTEVLNEIRAIRKDLNFIKEHIKDIFLSEDDEASLDEAELEYKAGKSISLDDLEKELG